LSFALFATGCQNGIELPAVNLTLPLVNNVTLGPSAGVPGGVTVAGAEFALGEFCGIVDEEAIDEAIRAALGETAAGLIEIKSITLKGIVFTARAGNFNSFDLLALSIAPKDGALIPFGSLSAESGFGLGFTISADDPIDLREFLAATDCFAAALALTGTTPATDLKMRIDAFVTVEATASVTKAFF
jgi:hypothetical protein